MLPKGRARGAEPYRWKQVVGQLIRHEVEVRTLSSPTLHPEGVPFIGRTERGTVGAQLREGVNLRQRGKLQTCDGLSHGEEKWFLLPNQSEHNLLSLGRCWLMSVDSGPG